MYLATLRLPPHLSEHDLECLGPVFESFSCGHYVTREREDDNTSDWLMRWILEDLPDPTDLTHRIMIWDELTGLNISPVTSQWEIEKIDESRDWLAESYQGFQPFILGPFFIHGSHFEGDPPDQHIPLQIDAATAFGSGEHGTTAGCLEFLAELEEQGFTPGTALDMGCGSGILAIGACKLWHEPVLGVDNDARAVDVAIRHRDMNKVPAHLNPCAVGDGFNTPEVAQYAPYDLIIANILAGPLKEMAAPLSSFLKDGGYVLLSGMLIEQAEEVLSSYISRGLHLIDQKHINGWATLLLKL